MVEIAPTVASLESINQLIPDRHTWGSFFKMVDLPALPSNAAQRVENSPLRDRQASEGIARASELGLGNWVVSRPGREFVRVEAQVNTPLPLFPINE